MEMENLILFFTEQKKRKKKKKKEIQYSCAVLCETSVTAGK